MTYEIFQGDCRELLRDLPDECIDALVTDPPYELGFMGKRWDASGIAYDVEVWREALRVLKPGGHLLAFGGTRTYHRMACAIEDAGFEVRDSIHWIYGSGFPKSMNVSKAIDKAAGAEGGRGPMKLGGERLARLENNKRDGEGRWGNETGRDAYTYLPATTESQQWQGWGTALKPAHEPIVVARKPLIGTVAKNVQAHGTGALNIDGTRVGYASEADFAKLAAGVQSIKARGGSMENSWKNSSDLSNANDASTIGRWPPNILLNHSPECDDECAEDCAVAEMNRQGDSAKFFPCFHYGTKAGRKERERGCENLPAKTGAQAVEREEGSDGLNSPRAGAGRTAAAVRNGHPTVKPIELMRWLVRLVTPPNGTVLDPFTGSGTTGVACVLESFDFIGFEQSAEYVEIAEARIADAQRNK